MASRVITQFVSDLSDVEIADGRGGPVSFAFRGANYTIDLTDDEAADFESILAPYTKHASSQRRGRRAESTRSAKHSDAASIRTWAAGRGIEVPSRGRIPAAVREQYLAAL